ncbi:MAG: biotin-dependent carboxyltransferase family protein [Crocinitomicaceae bacterium]
MIEVIRAGQFTTIQDLGRFSYRSMGVPVSGPMDSASANDANNLLGNDSNSPLLEMAHVGATLLFHQSATIALSGANCEVKLNNEQVEVDAVLNIESGSKLTFGAMKNGNFLYLAICGGFKVEMTLGSACYFEAVNGISHLKKGMQLRFDETVQQRSIKRVQRKTLSKVLSACIEVEKGPEFQGLSDREIDVLFAMEFTVSRQSNRMGYRLNEQVNFKIDEIISSPVQPGTIQLTQGGQLIVLMRDAQTTGGYSRILQLTENSINKLAQLPPNSVFKLKLIELTK